MPLFPQFAIVLLAGSTGALAAWLAVSSGAAVSPPDGRDFTLTRSADDPLKITPSRDEQLLAKHLGDFNLRTTVELGDGAELDLLFRKVEPRDPRVAQFHGRFQLLRLSTTVEGEPYRNREDSLFGDLRGGVKIAAGVPATILLEGRGRHVRANVAGRWFPWVETVDSRGSLAFIAHDGIALVRYLKITALDSPWRFPGWLILAVISAMAALLSLRVGCSFVKTAVVFALSLPVGGMIGEACLFSYLLPESQPSMIAVLLASGCGLPLACVLSSRRFRVTTCIGAALLGLVLLEVAARSERPRLIEDPRFDAHFGSQSGPAAYDAFAGRVNGSVREVHYASGVADRVMFLGGQVMFLPGGPDFRNVERHLGFKVTTALEQALGRKVDGIVMPTVFSNTMQQLAVFRRFYLDFAPRVLVFGVSRYEHEAVEPQRARVAFQRAMNPSIEPPLSTLWQLWARRLSGDQPASTPADLKETLIEVQALCRQHRITLVLATDSGVDAGLADVVEGFAREHEIPLETDVLTADGEVRADGLIKVIGDLLEKPR